MEHLESCPLRPGKWFHIQNWRMLQGSPRNCGCGMNLTYWFFKSSRAQKWPAFKIGVGEGIVRQSSSHVPYYSKPLVNFPLSLLYLLAYYLTSTIVCSSYPLESCAIVFPKLYYWNPAKPIEVSTFPMLLYLCSHVPHLENSCLLPLTPTQDIYTLPAL